MKKDGLVYTVIFSAVVAFLFVLPLAFANEVTKPQVQENAELSRKRAVLAAMTIPSASIDELNAAYSTLEIAETTVGRIYRGKLGTKNIVAMLFTGSGLWGSISGVLATDADLTSIIGLRFIAHSETPGLGGRIDENWFTSQFSGEQLVNGMIRIATGAQSASATMDKNDGVVDGITGATRTTSSVQVILNAAIDNLRKATGVNP